MTFWQKTEGPDHLPILHFVHGNSFPTGTYQVMLAELRSYYRIGALDLHAHDIHYPVTNNWRVLCDELIQALVSRYDAPVILVGHSFGGIVGLMVASMRPDLVRCLVLLDAPIIVGWRARLLYWIKKLGIIHYTGPAKRSKKRRLYWPSDAAALEHFSHKRVFSAWQEGVLRDYIRFGTKPHLSGVTLMYTREVETAIYSTLPHTLKRFCRRPFPVPIGFIQGEASEECRWAGMAYTKKLVGKYFVTIPGSHLYPMEYPKQAAEAIHHMIERLLAQ